MRSRRPGLFVFIAFLIAFLSCSKSGQRLRYLARDTTQGKTDSVRHDVDTTSHSTIVRMALHNGVYEVPIEINGIRLLFILDTGASSISISSAEATVLAKQGSLTNEDILGEQKFMTATGEIAPGTRINLREVKIGNRSLTNVEASITQNQNAPLLLGQTVLSRFGKISIDYVKNEISLEY